MLKAYKYKLMMALTAFLMFSSSCKKSFLEKLPPTALPPEIALATEADIQVALRGAYSSLRAVDYFGRTVPLIGDLMADNAYIATVNTGRYTLFNTYSWTTADLNIVAFWRGAYTSILRANNIINSALPASANMSQYRGEAYAIRALSYFYLIRYFARPYTDDPNGLGVPIVTVYDAEFKPTRSKISEVYTLMLADLTQAYSLMTQYSNSTQFSKYAARALQAKIYLTMGDKVNAKAAALDVINNGGFTSVTAANYLNYWATLTPRTDKLETLFEVSSDANANSGFDGLANIYNQSGYGDALLSADFFAGVAYVSATGSGAAGNVTMSGGTLTSVAITSPGSGYGTTVTTVFTAPPTVGATTATGTSTLTAGTISSTTVLTPGSGYTELLTTNDIRRSLYLGVTHGGVAALSANNKYPGTFGSEVSDTKILRMSEMYLIAAEASLPADEASALTYVNFITSRRNAPAIASTGAQLFEDIITERRKELALEGDRYLDLMRLKRDVIRNAYYPAAARNIPYANFRRVLPIPQAELDANPNIRGQQNPGY